MNLNLLTRPIILPLLLAVALTLLVNASSAERITSNQERPVSDLSGVESAHEFPQVHCL